MNGDEPPWESSGPFAVGVTLVGRGWSLREAPLARREGCPEEAAPPFGEAELEGCQGEVVPGRVVGGDGIARVPLRPSLNWNSGLGCHHWPISVVKRAKGLRRLAGHSYGHEDARPLRAHGARGHGH